MSDTSTPGEAVGVIDTVVVGGGLAGLMAAVTAARQPGAGRVVLCDGHPLGGRARCDDRDGYHFNRGPRALYIGGPAERTLQDLRVDTTAGGGPVLIGAAALDRGRLHLLPQGPGSTLRTSLFSAREKMAFAGAFVRFTRADPSELTGRTLARWLDDSGLAGAPRRLFEGLVRVATYCHAPDLLDAGAAVAAAQAGVKPGVRYLDGGWQSLVDALSSTAVAAGVELRSEGVQAVDAPDREGDGHVVRTAAGDLRARAVVLAVGTPDAAGSLLGQRPSSWSTLGPPVTAACLELGLRQPPPRRFVLGIDEPLYLSTHAPPARLAPEGHAVVHVMRYHGADEDLPASDQQAGLRRLAASVGIGDDDIVSDRFLAKMTVSGGLPLASVGGLAGRPPVAVPARSGVFVAGDWVGPEGLLLDAVAASATAAGQAAARSATMATV